MSPRYLGGRTCARRACVCRWNLFAVLSVQRAHTPVLLRLAWLTCKKKKKKSHNWVGPNASTWRQVFLVHVYCCRSLKLIIYRKPWPEEAGVESVRVTPQLGVPPRRVTCNFSLSMHTYWRINEPLQRALGTLYSLRPGNSWRSSSSHRAACFLCVSLT